MEGIKRSLLFALFLIMCTLVQAQRLTVQGKVVSKTDGESIIGATVIETNQTSNGTTATGTSDYQPGMVYIASSGNGKKYHRTPDCSGMDDATAVTVEQAEAAGYTPCKRCY